MGNNVNHDLSFILFSDKGEQKNLKKKNLFHSLEMLVQKREIWIKKKCSQNQLKILILNI